MLEVKFEGCWYELYPLKYPVIIQEEIDDCNEQDLIKRPVIYGKIAYQMIGNQIIWSYNTWKTENIRIR